MNKENSKDMILISLVAIVVIVVYQCPFKMLLGVSCPGCGMTRAFYALIHGQVWKAFYFHPMFPIVIILGIGYVLWKFNKIKLSDAAISRIVIGIAILFLLVYLIRIGRKCEVVRFDLDDSLIGKIYHKLG